MVNFPLMPQKTEVPSVPLGMHESKDWDANTAVQTVKRAAMYYYKEIFDSTKAGSYEALSNTPTWVMAAMQPNPNILGSATAGALLTSTFVIETALHGMKLNKILGILEEFQQNVANPEKVLEAAKILEKRTHGEGLLFENIPEYNLDNYPSQTFKQIMDTRRLFTDKNELKGKVLNLCSYLKNEPKAAALKVAFSPFQLGIATLELSANVIGLGFDVAKNGVTNILRPSKLKDVMNGLSSMIQLPFHSQISKNQSRHKVKQKSFFSDSENAQTPEVGILQKTITEEDASEIIKTTADMHQNIGMQKYEAARFLTEGTFMGGHALEMTNHFNPQSLMEFDVTSDNIKFALSAGSLLLAWEPFAHIGKNLKSLKEIGEGHRAMDIQHYEKLNRQLEIALKHQHDDNHDHQQPS